VIILHVDIIPEPETLEAPGLSWYIPGPWYMLEPLNAGPCILSSPGALAGRQWSPGPCLIAYLNIIIYS